MSEQDSSSCPPSLQQQPPPKTPSYISMNDSVSTDFDPDHKSYTRHTESSESARRALPKEYNKSVRSLADLSSTLSASSSLSGSTQHPHNDEDDDEDDNDDNDTDMNDSDARSSHSPVQTTFSTSTSPTASAEPASTIQDVNMDLPAAHPIASPSLYPQGRSQHTPHKHKHGSSRFKHYHKPKVTESPRLVYLCQKFINEKNVEALALIARRRGLPPKLRQYAWPLLLASHPYVLNPSVDAEFPTPPSSQEQIPVKRIKNEIARYQKKQAMMASSKSRTPTNNSTSTSGVTNTVVDTQRSNNQSTTPAHPSTRTTPISESPTGSSCTELAQLNKTEHLGENITSASLEAQKHEAIEDAIKAFLSKWGRTIPYSSAMVYMAFCLAEWVDPVCRLDDRNHLIKGVNASGTNVTDSQASSPELGPVESYTGVNGGHDNPYGPTSLASSRGPSPISSGNATPTLESQAHASAAHFSLHALSFQLPYVFSEVFEHLMLLCFHSTPSMLNGPRGPCDSSDTERISFFLSVSRRLLPDLAKHFDDEDVLSVIGGDEWLMWWIKWMGAKVWDRRDRARIWDMHFGWRPAPAAPGFDLHKHVEARIKHSAPDSIINDPPIEMASESLGPLPSASPPPVAAEEEVNTADVFLAQLERDLGPDPFWSPNLDDESTAAIAATATGKRSMSISARLTSEPLLEHLFVCIVLLKSKAATLLELDQSEIRGCLGRLYRSKDIESIIAEAGECWRTWRHAEDLEDEDLR